jgi:signal transduction histidine kinase
MTAGLRYRLILTFAVYALAVFGGGGFIFYEQSRRNAERELGEKLVAVGLTVAANFSEDEIKILSAAGARTKRRVVETLKRGRGGAGLHRLYIFDADGRSLADADDRRAGAQYPELTFEREAVNGVFRGEPVIGHLFTGRDGNDYKAAYLPLATDDAIPAALAVVGSATFLQSIKRVRSGLFLTAVLGVVGSIFLSAVLARTIINPILRLVGAADRIRAGDLETPVPDLGGDELGYLGHTLERMRTAVLARERSLRAMLGGVAHEIRNPLGGIELFAGLLRRDVDEGGTEKVDRILQEVRHLDGIITDFLDYARPNEPSREAFPAAEVLKEVEELVLGALDSGSVRCTIAPDDSLVHADRAHFRQVLLNVVQNAIQAHEGGAGGSVHVTTSRGGKWVDVRVSDDGPGIPADIRDRVFEPFFTTRQQGSGLGLSIARELTERNGGELSVEDGPSGGTVVAMRWPAGERT